MMTKKLPGIFRARQRENKIASERDGEREQDREMESERAREQE